MYYIIGHEGLMLFISVFLYYSLLKEPKQPYFTNFKMQYPVMTTVSLFIALGKYKNI